MSKKTETTIAIIGIIIIILCIVFIKRTPAPAGDGPGQFGQASEPTSITEEDIKEDTFKGTRSVVAGSSGLAQAAQSYIDNTVTSFKQSADQDVPAMRAQFGADSPTASYEIDITATDVKGETTESIVIDQYVYTGGANGNDAYKVFTASLATGQMLSLSDVIAPGKEDAFVAYVKKQLSAWRPEGSTDEVVFPESLADLTFDSFENWAFDGKGNLVIYFDKYEIGPGVLGAVAFPLPVATLQSFLTADYH